MLNVGRGLAVTGGLVGVWTFWPRRFWSIDLRPFREKYLASEVAFTKLHLLDTQVDMIERMGIVLNRKAQRLKLAMGGLVGAVIVVAIGLGLPL